MQLYNRFKRFFKLGKSFPVQTFTFYIPAPPKRKTGYREKEFDKVFHQFIRKGFRVLDTKIEAHSGPASSGLWLLFVLQPLTNKAAALDLEEEFSSEFSDVVEYNEDLEILTEE